MLFNSFEFVLVFLPVVWVGFFLLGARGHARLALAWLTLASLFFYAWWNPAYLPLLLLSIACNYLVGRALRRRPSRALLAFGVAANLAAIGYFKYAGFLALSVSHLPGVHLDLGHIVLPLAISFYTFQQIAYLVDAYRGEIRGDDPLRYALFVTFFPQLIAGPIVHHSETMPQFAERRTFRIDLDSLALGLSVFVIGLFKKVVLADGIAVHATPLFDAALAGAAPSLIEAWGGALAYTFQLYFDFSGYSDMAVGLGLMFNIRIPLNFNSPYKAVNAIDFWRRWHMTLSRFLRDYLYIPLGGNRFGALRRYENLLLTMLLGGLWHGAGWTFVAWGGLHGLYLCVNHAWHHFRRRVLGHDLSRSTWLGRVSGRAVTFLAVVVSWVFFRAESFDAAGRILAGMAGLNGIVVPDNYFGLLGPLGPALAELGLLSAASRDEILFGGTEHVALLAALFLIAFLLPNTQEWVGLVEPEGGARRPPREEAGQPRPPLMARLAAALPRWRPSLVTGSVLGAILCYSLLLMFAETPSEFLYFQF